MARTKAKLRKGQPIGARSASGRKRDRTPQRLAPCDGILRRRAAYGAAAKGSTLLNACGIDGKLLDFVVDRSTYKQGRFMPIAAFVWRLRRAGVTEAIERRCATSPS